MEATKQIDGVRKLLLKDYDIGETLGTGELMLT